MGMGQPPSRPSPAPVPKKLRKHKDRADKDDSVASDKHVSNEFSQCSKMKDDDYKNKVLQISKSCEDLAIDG